ncbi:MAG: hypothetical protein JSS02_10900 [Planctomycetes bacterium]|nr:hypothetical protein [Planctomycetota bacterium]
MTWRWKRGVAAAVGVYGGLVGYLLVFGNPEYPLASLIALAVHGLIPAIAGSLAAFMMYRFVGRWPQSPPHA